jgi:hypothetical protein
VRRGAGVARGEFVADPERDFAGRAVAEDEEGTVGEFVAGADAGGVAETVLLSGEGGDECEEEGGELGRCHQ